MRLAASIVGDLRKVLAEGQRPVIVGGTGLYFMALTEGLAEVPPTPPEIRAKADARLRDAGLRVMAAELDAGTAARIDLRNPARVQRAWEVLQATGRGLAQWQAGTGPPLMALDSLEALVTHVLVHEVGHHFGLSDEAMDAIEASAR